MKAPDTGTAARPRRLLFQKYFTARFVAVVVPLLANGASETWFGCRDQREVLSQRLHAEARSAAGKIQGFLDNITDQQQWTVQSPWRDGMDERHRFDVLRLMRQVPAVLEVTLVDGEGIERLHVSRVDPESSTAAPTAATIRRCSAPGPTESGTAQCRAMRAPSRI